MVCNVKRRCNPNEKHKDGNMIKKKTNLCVSAKQILSKITESLIRWAEEEEEEEDRKAEIDWNV